jgi:hypothetical protein
MVKRTFHPVEVLPDEYDPCALEVIAAFERNDLLISLTVTPGRPVRIWYSTYLDKRVHAGQRVAWEDQLEKEFKILSMELKLGGLI